MPNIKPLFIIFQGNLTLNDSHVMADNRMSGLTIYRFILCSRLNAKEPIYFFSNFEFMYQNRPNP